MDILELIEDTVEVDAKTFGLAVLEKVAKLDVTQEQMQEFVELVEYWTERMEDDVENLLDMIVCEDGCGCEDEHCHCGCEDDCECDENCECGCQDGEECTCHEEKECHCHDKKEDKKQTCGCKSEHKEKKECKSKNESTCTCGDPNCTCGCNEGKPCTCKK